MSVDHYQEVHVVAEPEAIARLARYNGKLQSLFRAEGYGHTRRGAPHVTVTKSVRAERMA